MASYTKEDVQELFLLWSKAPRFGCDCPDHHPQRQKICDREKAWRAYTRARDEFYGLQKKLKKFDIDAILDAFEGVEN